MEGDYIGVDLDRDSIRLARVRRPYWPSYTVEEFGEDGPYGTIVLLAVIEHVPNPAELLRYLINLHARQGRIVLTAPNPSLEWVRAIGARLGLFGLEGHHQHQSLLNLFGQALSAFALNVLTTWIRANALRQRSSIAFVRELAKTYVR